VTESAAGEVAVGARLGLDIVGSEAYSDEIERGR